MARRPNNQKEKVERRQEEKLASSGGFIIAGIYLLISGELPMDIAGWGKFVGVFVAASLILYFAIYFGKKVVK